MPTYEYACGACGHHFEEFQSIKAKATTLCPECGKRKVKRLISAGAGFIFKGSGFYITDYRSESYKAAAKSDSAVGTPKTDGAKTDAPKTESTKTETAAPKITAKAEGKSDAKSASKPAAAATTKK